MATLDHVTQVLVDATGPLWQLHRRVLEAGCEVNPDWKLGTFYEWNGGSRVETGLGSFCFAGKKQSLKPGWEMWLVPPTAAKESGESTFRPNN